MNSTDLKYQVGQKLDSIPFGWFHFWIIIVLSLVGFTEGYDTALTGSLIVLAHGPLHLVESDITWLVIGPTAVLCAAMLAGSFACDWCSRKTILQIGVIVSTFFTLIIPFMPNADALIAARMLGGIGFGLALPAAYPIGSELLPAKHRKTFGWIYEAILGVAFTVIPFVGYLVAGNPNGWKLAPLPGGLMLFVLPLLVHFVIPESPRWHVANGRAEAAIAAVNAIIRRAGNRVPQLVGGEGAPAAAQATKLPPYAALFSASQIRFTFVAALTWAGALVSYYIFAFLLPKALHDQGLEVKLSFGLATLSFLVTIPGKILNGYLMEWIGRKKTIFLALFLSIFGLFLMVIAHRTSGSNVVFVAGAVLTGVTVLSSFPAVRIYMTEQFPNSLRARGYFLAEMIGRVIAGLAVPIYLTKHTSSPAIFFGTVLAFSLVGAFVPMLFGRETVGQLELVSEHASPIAVGAH